MKSDTLPAQFTERLKTIVEKNKMPQVLETFCFAKPSTFRANTLKITSEKLKEDLTKIGVEAEQVDWYPDAFILKNVEQRFLTETQLYKQGYLYVQSLSSMIPPLVLDPKPGDIVLDITAAPGSKTTQMAALMNNQGHIVANDRSRVRLYILKANLQTLGITNVSIENKPAQQIWKKYPEYFDKTLVDVPCSLEGRFRCDSPQSYDNWSIKKIRKLADYQRWILRSAVSATKVGGTIVYSTCTMAPEENEAIIDWIVNKEKGSLEILPIKNSFDFLTPGLTGWQKKEFDKSLTQTARILPNKTMEAFYIALLKKTKPTIKY